MESKEKIDTSAKKYASRIRIAPISLGRIHFRVLVYLCLSIEKVTYHGQLSIGILVMGVVGGSRNELMDSFFDTV